jgi:catechol 2,3-dioxygenase-like lactoylglutathione lyase family enzyme
VSKKEPFSTIGQPVPELPVEDVERAQQYYRDVLGFEIGWLYPGKEIGAVSRKDAVIFFRRTRRADEGDHGRTGDQADAGDRLERAGAIGVFQKRLDLPLGVFDVFLELSDLVGDPEQAGMKGLGDAGHEFGESGHDVFGTRGDEDAELPADSSDRVILAVRVWIQPRSNPVKEGDRLLRDRLDRDGLDRFAAARFEDRIGTGAIVFGAQDVFFRVVDGQEDGLVAQSSCGSGPEVGRAARFHDELGSFGGISR